MLGFSPLADNALADDAPVAGGAPAVDTNRDNFAFLLSGPVGALVVGAVRDAATTEAGQEFQPSALVTGAPIVAAAALSSTHDVSADDIVTAAPIVASAGLSLVHDLTAANIATAAPVIGTPSVDVFSLLAPDAIVTGAPVLALPALSTIRNFTAAGVTTGAPVVATVDLSSQQDLSAVGIVTAAPMLGTPLAEEAQPFPVNGIVTGAPTIRGSIDTPGSIDAYVRALQAAGLATSSSPRIQFSPDGTKYFVKPDGDGAGRPPQRYDLTTPWDVATGTLVNANAFNITTTNIVQDFQLSDDGLYIAFLMWANSDGKSAIHLYSLAEPFVTNYTGLISSAGSDDGYTFVRSFIIDQGFRRIKTFRHLDGKLYTVDAPLTQNSTLQRRAVNNVLFSSLGVANNATVVASTLTTTVTGYSVAFLSLGGTSRIYHSNAAYDPLTLAQLEVSGQTLGLNLRYQLKPDGIGIVVPQLAEIDTDTSVTIDQEGAIGAVSIATGQPALAQTDLDQQHTFAPVAVLTGSPVIAATDATQDIDIAANDIDTGQPIVPDGNIGQVHQMGAGSIVTGQPVLQSTNTFGSGALFATGIIAGAPDLGLLSLSQEQQVVVDSITAGQPSLQNADMVQGVTLAAVNINAAPPSLDLTSVSQDHEFALDGVASEPPSLGQTTVTQGQFTALIIATGSPVLGLLTMQREQALSADGITTGPPALVTLLLNGSARRIVDQSASSNNNVAVTTGSNIAIVSERYSRSA
jgi:hypothetical protein